MAKLEEVFVVEADRKEADAWNKIHLFKMGDFWRAYEWSAWLIAVITYNENVRQATKDRKPIHVTRMKRTDIDGTYCFVGFPVKSVEKYIPERENFENVSDKHVTITISLPQPNDGTTLSFERMNEAFEKWKDGIELTERNKKDSKATVTTSQPQQPMGGGILSQIMAYPLSERTAIENIQFIQSLKQQLSAIL